MSLFTTIRGTQVRCLSLTRPKTLSSVLNGGQYHTRGIASTTIAQPESPIRYIRNIGIVAHVDAVSSHPWPNLEGYPSLIQDVGQNNDHGADAL
jgi:hypothetical protein